MWRVEEEIFWVRMQPETRKISEVSSNLEVAKSHSVTTDEEMRNASKSGNHDHKRRSNSNTNSSLP
jgi:acyl-ACP thioesterase